MAIELLDTAIEKLADRVQPEIDPAIKIVPDLDSAAVAVAPMVAAGIWIDAVAVALGRRGGPAQWARSRSRRRPAISRRR